MIYSPLEFALAIPEFCQPSWAKWREVLAQITPAIRALFLIAGRGSGKSRVAALIAVCFAIRTYLLAPGERAFVGIFAPDKKQAAITFGYALGLLLNDPDLAAYVVNHSEASGTIELKNGVTVEVLTATKTAPRSRTYALAIVEEAAFLSTDEDSAEPDRELIRAIKPGLGRLKDGRGLLIVLSSPYSKSGILFEAWQRFEEGKLRKGELVINADTASLNPTFDTETIDDAYIDDPVAARSEYGAEFRNDIETYVSLDVVKAVTVAGRTELRPSPSITYSAFIDFAGGGGKDSATLAISHAEQRNVGASVTARSERVAVLDLVKEVRPPFSPEQTCGLFAVLMKPFGLKKATADRYAADFAVDAMKRHGVELKPAEKVKSDLYLELLPLINSRRVELLELPRLQTQLAGLERRTARGGHDSVDHKRGAHDDIANSVAGALVLAAVEPKRRQAVWGTGRLGGRVVPTTNVNAMTPGRRAHNRIVRERLEFFRRACGAGANRRSA